MGQKLTKLSKRTIWMDLHFSCVSDKRPHPRSLETLYNRLTSTDMDLGLGYFKGINFYGDKISWGHDVIPVKTCNWVHIYLVWIVKKIPVSNYFVPDKFSIEFPFETLWWFFIKHDVEVLTLDGKFILSSPSYCCNFEQPRNSFNGCAKGNGGGGRRGQKSIKWFLAK